MRFVRYEQFGGPEVLQVHDAPDPVPGPGEVRVAITASGINPADVNTITGTYGTRPELPSTPGFEAAGVIDAVGDGVDSLKIGDRVMIPLGGLGRQGAWRDRGIVRANRLYPTPDALSDSQAGSAWIVYLTAWVGLNDVLGLQQGDTVVVTAAGSAVGRAAIQVAKIRGYRAIGVVRRPEAVDDIMALGYEAALVHPGSDLGTGIKALTDGKGAAGVLDCVAGATGTAALDGIRAGGTLAVYGRLSNEPIQIDPTKLLFAEHRVQGFWLSRWLGTASRDKMNETYAALLGHFGRGELVPEIDREFPLEQVQDACRYIRESGRHGKIVLTSPKP